MIQTFHNFNLLKICPSNIIQKENEILDGSPRESAFCWWSSLCCFGEWQAVNDIGPIYFLTEYKIFRNIS